MKGSNAMKKTTCVCDYCGLELESETISKIPTDSLGEPDIELCTSCFYELALTAWEIAKSRPQCTKCKGRGERRIVDEERTFAEASCGENRTLYKNVPCVCGPEWLRRSQDHGPY